MVSINKIIVVVLMYFFTMPCFAKLDCRYINGTPLIVNAPDQNHESAAGLHNIEQSMCYIEGAKRNPEKKKECMDLFDKIKNNGAIVDSENICIQAFGTPAIKDAIEENKNDYAALHPDSRVAEQLSLDNYVKTLGSTSCDQLPKVIASHKRAAIHEFNADFANAEMGYEGAFQMRCDQKKNDSQWSEELKAYRANKAGNK